MARLRPLLRCNSVNVVGEEGPDQPLVRTPPWTHGQTTLSLLIVQQEAQFLVQDQDKQEAQFLVRHMMMMR